MSRKWSLLNSVIISVMVSETKIYHCHELPDWQRGLWLLWSILPAMAAQVNFGFEVLLSDWLAGWSFIFNRLTPLEIASG